MKFYVLASLIIFCLVTTRAVKKSEKQAKKENDSFWEREAKANEVRKKPIDHLDYIPVPSKILTIVAEKKEPPFPEYLEILESLCKSKIINLSNFTNTDLKLEYGTANLTVLSEYDQNFSLFIRTLQQAGEACKKAEDFSSAKTLWEYAVSVGSDITGTYLGLAALYESEQTPDKIQELITAAKLLDSANKSVIVRKLEEFLQSTY